MSKFKVRIEIIADVEAPTKKAAKHIIDNMDFFRGYINNMEGENCVIHKEGRILTIEDNTVSLKNPIILGPIKKD